MSDGHRINFTLSAEESDYLYALSKVRGKSIKALLTDAIALRRWYQQTLDDGGRVLVKKPDGSLMEILPR